MKTLLVTGASRGVGFEICKQAAANSHTVIALSRNISPLKGIPNIHPFSVDLSNELEVVDFVKEISSSFKSIDVLINNAGSLINKPFLEISSSDFEAVFKVNVFAVASLTRLMLPMMNAKGHVLNITSMGGFKEVLSSLAYLPTVAVREPWLYSQSFWRRSSKTVDPRLMRLL